MQELRCTLCNRKLGEYRWATPTSPVAAGVHSVVETIKCSRCGTMNTFTLRP